MASQVASKEKLLQFYLFGIASQEAIFEALLEAMPKGPSFAITELAQKQALQRFASELLCTQFPPLVRYPHVACPYSHKRGNTHV